MKVFFNKCSEAIKTANESKSFACFYSAKDDANENIHLHECCEILFCLSGGKTFFIDERIYDVDDGDIFVLNQFESHKITSESGKVFERYVMQINPEFLYAASSEETDLSGCFNIRGENISHKIPTCLSEREKICEMFKNMAVDCECCDDIFKNIAAVYIIASVNKYFFEKNKDYTYRIEYKNKTMITAIKYINENFSGHLSLEMVAKECFVSVNELCRLFKKHMGTTVNRYINSRRITEAKKLLKSGASVSLTAEKCGFMDYTGFIRSFKKAVGISPGRYKNRS